MQDSWTNPDTSDVLGELWSSVDGIKEDLGGWNEELYRFLAQYEGNPNGRGGSPLSLRYSRRLTVGSSWNVSQSCIEAAISKLGKLRPRALFLPNSGDFEARKKTVQLTRFCDAEFAATHAYEHGRRAIKDAMIFGTGYLHVFSQDNLPKVERVFPTEILVDQKASQFAEPHQLYRYKTVPTDSLVSLYPEHENAIRLSGTKAELEMSLIKTDMTDVVEAWSKKVGDQPGRHVIAVRNVLLLDEEWEDDDFPIVPIRWIRRPYGYYGQGICEQLINIAAEINYLLDRIQKSISLLAVPTLLVSRNADIAKGQFSNTIGNIIKYSGNVPPKWNAPNVVSGELFSHLERNWQRAFEIVGISQLSASSRKPSGLDSGEALRVFSDLESERFQDFGQSIEDFYLEVARRLIKVAQRLDEETDEGVQVRVRSNDLIHVIKWREINLEEDRYEMDVYPTSLLPTRPEGRLQRIAEMKKAGFITDEQAIDLLEIPDLNQFEDLEKAARDSLRQVIEDIVFEGKYTSPEPFDDLIFAKQYATAQYHKAHVDGVPEEHIDLLRQFILQVQELIDASKPPASPGPPKPPSGPMGGPPPA